MRTHCRPYRWLPVAAAFAFLSALIAAGVIAPAFAQLGGTINVGLQYATIVGWETPPPPVSGEGGKIEQLQRELRQGTNYILQAELKMLQYKARPPAPSPTPTTGLHYSTIVGWGDDSSWGSRGWGNQPSGMHVDLYGGFGSRGTGANDRAFDLITGRRAIEESLQLGSIDTDVNEWNDPERQLLRDVRQKLEQHKRERGSYPPTLKDFATSTAQIPDSRRGIAIPAVITTDNVWYGGRQQRIADLAHKFVYQRSADGQSFTLALADAGRQLSLADIKPLEIRSHPWAEMLAGKTVATSPIFSLVPADHFLVHFADVARLAELQEALRQVTGPTESLFQGQDLANLMDKVARRLGISDVKQLLPFVSEVAFVSEDLDFYPKTHYAVIAKPKGATLQNLLGKLPTTQGLWEPVRLAVGDYLVLATNRRIAESIQAAFQRQRRSLAEAQDFQYTLAILEPRRDGVAYLSEAFITKLVGPEHRINARRRNAAVKALETLQYVSFAYRDLTGSWPRSIQQVADEGYLNAAGIYRMEDYEVDTAGWVSHRQWGSLHNLSGLADVPVGAITQAEKTTYERFRDGYQNFWREFFDPIGVGITVADQILLHTVILPLIDESEYNMLAEIFGGAPMAFDFIRAPHRVPALQAVAKLNDLSWFYRQFLMESASDDDNTFRQRYEQDVKTILQRYGVSAQSYDAACGSRRWERRSAASCREALQRQYPKLNVAALRGDISAVEARLGREAANAALKKWLGWQREGDVLAFLGDEVMLGIGAQNSFNVRNIADLDIYLGLKLTDVALAKEFLLKVFQKFTEEVGGRDAVSLGLFSFSTTQPVQNTYRDVAYWLVPTGFVNAYYTFLDDTFYLAFSQLAINRLIDATLDEKGKPFEQRYAAALRRGMAYIGEAHNLALHADLDQFSGWKQDLLAESFTTRALEDPLEGKLTYLREARTLAKALSGYNGTLGNVAGSYYRSIPTKLLEADLSVSNGSIILTAQGVPYDLETVDAKTSEAMLERTLDAGKSRLLESWGKVKNASLGLKLTEEGLDSRLAFTNPLRPQPDDRFALPQPTPPAALAKPRPIPWGVAGMIVGGIAVVLGGTTVAVLLWQRRRRPPTAGGLPPPGPDPFQDQPPEVPPAQPPSQPPTA